LDDKHFSDRREPQICGKTGSFSENTATPDATTPEAALTQDWLARTDQTLSFYRKLREEFETPQ
jgi:hypothetical protein